MSVTVNGMFVLGNYKTKGGLPATVAKLTQEGTTDWILKGAITAKGVLCIHKWTLKGKSLMGEAKFDLVSEDDVRG